MLLLNRVFLHLYKVHFLKYDQWMYHTFFSLSPVNIYVVHPITMRTTPSSIDFANITIFTLADVNFAVSALTITAVVQSALISRVAAAVTGGTAGTGAVLLNDNNTAGYIGLSAEL